MPYWVHSAPADYRPGRRPPGQLAHRCARGDYCSLARPGDDGETIPAWADPPSPFCPRDYRNTAQALASLPRKYADLRRLLGHKPPPKDDKVTTSRTPPVPLRLDYDALMYELVAVLCSWEERIQAAGGLDCDTSLSRRRRHQYALTAAVRLLAPRLDQLLGLPGEPMTRHLPITSRLVLPPGTTGMAHPHAGYVEAQMVLDGAAAGRELLALSQHARSLLGETQPPPERLTGVPCKRCDKLALEDARPEYKSHCTECGHLLTPDEYKQHVSRWAVWARAQQTAVLLEAS